MTKNFLFAVALLNLALASGCAKGGNGTVPPPPPAINVNDGNLSVIYPNQSVTFTATVGTPPEPVTVTWSLSGSACTGTPNPCGAIDPTSGVYQAPATPPSPSGITITATSQTNSSQTGSMTVNLALVSVVVTPLTVSVGEHLVQQFTAVTLPDDAPQTFTWTCTPSQACGGFVPGPNNSGVAVYTAPASSQSGVQVTATSTVQQSPLGVGTSKVSVTSSRLAGGSTYAFHFSGYDSSNHPVAIAGSLTAGSGGAINSGVEDVAINGDCKQYTTVSGSYTPSPNNSNDISNNLGTLTLIASGGPTYMYTAVLTSSGIIRMIESDGAGTGSGVLQKSSTAFNSEGQTYAFGFTGVDSSGNRTGYVGLLPMTPNANGTGGTISGGLLDTNDGGNAKTVCNSPPCGVTGTYTLNANGVWQMTLNSGVSTFNFDFYVSSGTAQSKTATGPLTLYAISTDPIATNPAVSGSMVYQVPLTSGYNNAAFNGTSVSNLTGWDATAGANVNVSLTNGSTDGTSGGTGGTGGFTGTFDQNDNGTILSVPPASPFTYTYVASSGAPGRYIFQMLGNPTVTPAQPPLPFVLYASGANRGFLLDQSSPAVIAGTMDPQLTPNNFSYAPSEMPGTYAAATIGNGDSPLVQNLLLTSTGNATYVVAGTENPGNGTLSGTYTMNNNSAGGGTGTITLTSPPHGAVANYVIYAIDASGISGSSNAVITDFMMMGLTSGTPSPIIFAQE